MIDEKRLHWASIVRGSAEKVEGQRFGFILFGDRTKLKLPSEITLPLKMRANMVLQKLNQKWHKN